MMNICPSVEILKRFISATLSDSQAEEFLAHLDTCPACAERLSALEKSPVEKIDAGLRDLQDKKITATSSLPLKIGQYEILEKIGQGGMGVVYRAVHPHLKREVALKVIRDSRLGDASVRERFVQEIQALGSLSHPNIVLATDAGIDGDTPFIVTEFLDGEDFASYVDEHGKMPIKQAVDCLRQAATGLAFAHKAGYVHRDIKPSNLFLLRNGTVKILDLGLVRSTSPLVDRSQTESGHILGSPDFMAPEQFRGGVADVRSDIYSLGQTFAWILHGNSESLPPRLEAILTRMTAGLPERRFQSVGEVLKATDALATNGRYRKILAILSAVVAVCLVLIIVALVGPQNSSGDAESVVEPPPVTENMIIENVKAEIKRDAQHERKKVLLASPEDVKIFREELNDYKKDKIRYDTEMKEYADQMEEWEENKTGHKPSKPFPAIPPIMPPLQFPPEVTEEYKEVMKDRENQKPGENESKPASPAPFDLMDSFTTPGFS